MRRVLATAAVLALAAACSNAKGTPQTGPSGSGTPGGGGPVIGLLYTISGQGGEFAQAALGSGAIAAEDAGSEGVGITVESADYGGEPKKAAKFANELVDKGAVGIVVATDDPDVATQLADFDAVPLVYALISRDAAVSSNPTAFRITASNKLEARKIAEYLSEHRGYQKIAILHDSTSFGREGARDLEAAFAREDANVVMDWQFKIGGDIHTPVTYAGQLGAEALVLWTQSAAEAGRITIEIQHASESYQLVLSGNLATASYGKNASSQIVPTAFRDGILSVGTWPGPWFADIPAIGSFFTRFKTAQNALAPVQAANVYDGVLLLAEAVKRGGAGGPGALAQAIESTTDFEGAGVPLSFSSSNHEGVGSEDMAMWGFTRNQDSAGGEFFPDVDTGGGFFTIIPVSATIPAKYSYVLAGLPG